MIINQSENNLQFPNDDLNSQSSFNSNSNSELISTLMLNPKKYREFKLNVNRVNNIDNEINLLKTQDTFKKINFSEIIQIEYNEYITSIKESKEIIDSLTENDILDIISHKKLLSFEKHVLEIYSYLIGQKFFDWTKFRENFNLYDAKTKMSNVNYSKLNVKEINLFLNKISRTGKMKIFLKNINFSYPGLESIYEWVRSQIKIYFYLIQNNLIPKKIPVKAESKSKTYTNLNINKKNKLMLYLCNNMYDDINNNDKNLEEDKISVFNYSNDKKFNYTNYNRNKNNLLITGLPDLYNENNQNNNYTQYSNHNTFYLNKFQNKNNDDYIQKKYFALNDKFNTEIINDKKEEKTVKLLPLLKYKTYHQMRQYFNMEAKINKKIEKKHLEDVKMSKNNRKNNIKILTMIGNNKIGVLNNIPLFKMQKIIEET